jgi:hypothetical protein
VSITTGEVAQNWARQRVNSGLSGADRPFVTTAKPRSRRKSQLRLIVLDDARLLLGEQAAQDRQVLRALDAHSRRMKAALAS